MSIKIVIYLSILFFISEFILMITKRSKKNDVKTRIDKKSLTLLWVAIPLGLTLGFFKANYREWDTLNISIAFFGLCFFAIGIIIRWISIFQLDKEFTVDVAITENHNLKTEGMYKIIRHPSYAGLLLICVGLAIAMNSITSFVVIAFPILLAVIYRIKVEENILQKEFGDLYKTYMLKTNKLIPKLY